VHFFIGFVLSSLYLHPSTCRTFFLPAFAAQISPLSCLWFIHWTLHAAAHSFTLPCTLPLGSLPVSPPQVCTASFSPSSCTTFTGLHCMFACWHMDTYCHWTLSFSAGFLTLPHHGPGTAVLHTPHMRLVSPLHLPAHLHATCTFSSHAHFVGHTVLRLSRSLHCSSQLFSCMSFFCWTPLLLPQDHLHLFNALTGFCHLVHTAHLVTLCTIQFHVLPLPLAPLVTRLCLHIFHRFTVPLALPLFLLHGSAPRTQVPLTRTAYSFETWFRLRTDDGPLADAICVSRFAATTLVAGTYLILHVFAVSLVTLLHVYAFSFPACLGCTHCSAAPHDALSRTPLLHSCCCCSRIS